MSKEKQYGYHLFAYYHKYENSESLVEFFEHNQKEELEARIRELLVREYNPIRVTDIHVIYGEKKWFTTTKEVATEVELKDE